MISRCPEPAQLAALDDREATENEAAALRAHLATCASCAAEVAALRALRTEIAGPVVDVDVDALAVRVEEAIRKDAAPRRRPHLWLLAAALACGIGLTTLVVARLPGKEAAELSARGAPPTSIARRDVALALFERRGDRLVAVEDGAKLGPDTLFAMSWASRGARVAHRGVVLAIDSAREVHWMYPAFVSTGHVPEPIAFAPGEDETPMATVVRLGAPALGPLVIVALLDPAEADVVLRIEASKPEERTPEGLQALVRAADVRSWNLTLLAPKDGP